MPSLQRLEIAWTDDTGAYTLTLDPTGALRLQGPPPAANASARPVRPAPPRRGARWDDDEQESLRTSHAAGVPVKALAEAHERSEGSIRAQLVRMGLLTAEEAQLRYPPRPASPPAP